MQGGTPGNWAEQMNVPNPAGGALFPNIINIGFYQYKQPDNERNNRTWIVTIDQNFTKSTGGTSCSSAGASARNASSNCRMARGPAR